MLLFYQCLWFSTASMRLEVEDHDAVAGERWIWTGACPNDRQCPPFNSCISPCLPGRLRLAIASPNTLFQPTSTMAVSQLPMFAFLGLVNNQGLCMVDSCFTFCHLSFKNIFHEIPRAAHSLLHGYIFLEYKFISMFRNQVWKTRHKFYFMCKLKEWLCLCNTRNFKEWLYLWMASSVSMSGHLEESGIRTH